MERPEKPDLEQYGISVADIKAYRELLELEERKSSRSNDPWNVLFIYVVGTLGFGFVYLLLAAFVILALLIFSLPFVGLDDGHFLAQSRTSITLFLFSRNGLLVTLLAIFAAGAITVRRCVFRETSKQLDLEISRITLSPEQKTSCSEAIHIFEEYESKLKDYNRHRDKKRAEKRRQEEEFWLKLDGHKFESEFARLLRKNGYKARVTRGSGDDGIDIIASNHLGALVVQCKAWKARVPPKEIRDFVGAWSIHNNKIGDAWFIGLGGFTKSAIETAGKSGVKIMAIKHVIDLACQVED
jgi:HJR/Mrr/RecB family endonuclease